MVNLAFQICRLEVVVTGQHAAESSHRMWDSRAQGGAWMVRLETALKSDRPAEGADLLSRCRGYHPYGHCNGRRCCGAGSDDDLGRGARRGHCYALGHVVVCHLGPSSHGYGRCVHLVHVRHCVLRPCYALRVGPHSGHALCWYLMVVGAARRQVGTEGEYQRRDENVNLWAREPYVKDGRKP